MGDTASGLKVDYTEMETALKNVQLAITIFNTASTNIFDSDINDLAGMNSDFVKKFSRLLECIQKHDVKDLTHCLSTFYQDAETILENLKTEDERHANSKVEGSNG